MFHIRGPIFSSSKAHFCGQQATNADYGMLPHCRASDNLVVAFNERFGYQVLIDKRPNRGRQGASRRCLLQTPAASGLLI